MLFDTMACTGNAHNHLSAHVAPAVPGARRPAFEMDHATPPDSSWAWHPALPPLVLAWVALLAQSSQAAQVWAVCMAALAASRWFAAAPRTSARPPPPQPGTMPARRRADPRPSAQIPPPALPTHWPTLQAHCDPLTGLPNPAYLSDIFTETLPGLRDQGLSLCVLQVTVEGLQDAAARYGRDAYVHALTHVAKRLRRLVRGSDVVVAAGEERFMLLVSCPASAGATVAGAMAVRVLGELRRPLAYRTVSNLNLGGCVGTAVWPDAADTLLATAARAEEALRAAQHSGRGSMRHATAGHLADTDIPG